MEEPILCPLCNIALSNSISAVCPSCGLWWVTEGKETFQPNTNPAEPSSALHLKLRGSIGVGWMLFNLIFLSGACISFAAAVAVIWSVLNNPGWKDWMNLLVGVPFGGLVGVSCGAMVAGSVIHIFIPSYLEGNASFLQVRVWNTWEGVWQCFKRTDVKVPCKQLKGAAFSIGQGGQTQLFILHSSGLAFGTGWSGSRMRAIQLKERVIHWLSGLSN